MRLRTKLFVDYYVGGLLHAVLKPPTVLLGKLLGRRHHLIPCPSLTVIKMLGGGSLVIAYPALLGLKNSSQVGRLQLLTTPAVLPFAELLGVFDEIIVIRDDSAVHLLLDSLRAIRKLFRCDSLLDLEIHSRLTTVFSLFTCARNRVGFYTNQSFWRRRLSTHLLFCNVFSGIYEFYAQIAWLFAGRVPDMDECRTTFLRHLGLPGRVTAPGKWRIALAPCCSHLSKERMLEPEEWIQVFERKLPYLRGRAVEIHLLGAPSDAASLGRIAELLQSAFPDIVVINQAGVTLRQSVQLLAEMDELYCIDSALLHFGRLLGLPVVSYWGPTDPYSLIRLRSNGRDEIHYTRLACSPCVHVAQQAPCGGNNLCMRAALNPGLKETLKVTWLITDEPGGIQPGTGVE